MLTPSAAAVVSVPDARPQPSVRIVPRLVLQRDALQGPARLPYGVGPPHFLHVAILRGAQVPLLHRYYEGPALTLRHAHPQTPTGTGILTNVGTRISTSTLTATNRRHYDDVSAGDLHDYSLAWEVSKKPEFRLSF